jgi:hypothetical protein
MITALIIGVAKSALILIWNVINSLLSTVFSSYNTYLSQVVSSTGFRIAVGMIDVLVGWNWFVDWVSLAISTLIVVRLAKYIIGILTKG